MIHNYIEAVSHNSFADTTQLDYYHNIIKQHTNQLDSIQQQILDKFRSL